ncbi:Oxysterol-binding protein [Cucurbitaria berberidis CBS 394.84]|uniref:Oxysterol-binding protein n=1 Tax=Cucurbitaria berberidis CBS 394.84 TaxID=1168544 RepID=A0A9P4GJ96_9PLEO|nr:Oxysterol-binding protein [Cucurbitaria berberidis CBS 394.84]KAF1846662.1 Oxysterol-binding protein [Cucurbitaria berberidis CBS 394.84]
MSNDIASNRSTLKEFLASIATISGDLSNITAPPFVLAEYSTVEIPQYWADHPLLFVAPAAEQNPEKRALLVLKWFLGSLRNQQYAGRKEEEGVKKPLNAFLGELFVGSWQDEELGETSLVSEQVSHHPPITACYLWNDKHGIRAEGFTQQEITFSGSVSIKQKGYAVLHIDKYDEDYLIPVPNVKVKGILSGAPYPELHGQYSLISSNGYVSHVKFEGKGFFGSGQKNSFEARISHVNQPNEDIYTAKGAWSGGSLILDSRSGKQIEIFDVMALQSQKMEVADLSHQDPWESRRAWGDTIAALRSGDMKGTTNSKSVIEEGQRKMRKDEEAEGKQWKSIFFHSVKHDPVFEKLVAHDNGSYTVDREGGIWKVDQEMAKTAKTPYHGNLLPSNDKTNLKQREDSRNGNDFQDKAQITTAAEMTSGDPGEQRNKNGASRQEMNNGTAQQEKQPGSVTSSSQEISDAQIEAFLRAKHSNVNRG